MTVYGVFGTGMMGGAIARDLIDTEPAAEVVLCDVDEALLKEVSQRIGSSRLRTARVDATDHVATVEFLGDLDVAIGALPHPLSLPLVKAAVAAGTSLVDLVGEAPERRRELHDEAVRAGCLVVPGCGVAPGISNFCVGRGIELLDETESAVIYVGGLPKKKEGPLFYQTVYLLESVFNAYRRDALITRRGEPVRVAPLSGLEEIRFKEPIGALEAFYSDGLGSLPLTVARRVRGELAEKTLRYPGHVERIQILKDCGLLSDSPVETRDGVSVAPLDVLLASLREKLALGPEGDFLAMRVIVQGRREGRTTRHVFEVVDDFDPGRRETAMARTTGFTGASAARWIAGGKLTETGVLFPEELFLGERYEGIVGELAEKGVRIVHQER